LSLYVFIDWLIGLRLFFSYGLSRRIQVDFVSWISIANSPDVVLKIFVIEKQHIIRRLVHALQEATTAIVQAIEDMGKIRGCLVKKTML
jgi:hypothetical protein